MKPIIVMALALCFAMPVTAQDPMIRRCIGANGEPTFTDQPCSTVAPRVETDRLRGTPPPPAAQTCATAAEQLRERVIDAFTAGNAIALSGLFLWDGYRGRSSTSHLQALAKLVVEPLIAVTVESSSDSSHDRIAVESSLVIRSARDLEHVPVEAVSTFLVSAQGGCLWLVLPE